MRPRRGAGPSIEGRFATSSEASRALLLVASDRISAFDRVLSTVPFKGEVLSRVSAWWFDRCSDIIPNHVLPSGDPASLGIGRATLVRRVEMLPVEVVVRGLPRGLGLAGLSRRQGRIRNLPASGSVPKRAFSRSPHNAFYEGGRRP